MSEGDESWISIGQLAHLAQPIQQPVGELLRRILWSEVTSLVANLPMNDIASCRSMEEVAAEAAKADLRGTVLVSPAPWPTLALMSWPDVIAHLDDIWYPASIDLLVVDIGQFAFLYVDHEEFIVAGHLPDKWRVWP